MGPAFAEYTGILSSATSLARSCVGWPINIGSDDQLKAYLYEHKKYPIQKDKDTKKPTIDGDAVATLRTIIGPQPDLEEEDKNGLSLSRAVARIGDGADGILECRVMYAAAQQTLSHYIRPLQGVERIYPEYKIHAQASGRWSITNPPLGQLPSNLRDIICPDEGEAWVSYDSDAIELRLLAAISNDEPYLEALAKGWDVHSINARTIFNIPKEEELDKEDPRRVFAKRFVYRLHYGGYAGSAGDIPGAKQMGLDKTRLVEASNRYLAAHPSMLRWREEVGREIRQTGVSRTFMGRRRRMLGGTQAAIREAYNHPLQGGAADVLNITTIRIARAIPSAILAYSMHDSCTWAVPMADALESQAIMQEIINEPWDIEGRKVILPVKFKEIVYG